MKLTAEELEQGRDWVRAGNIDALERWVDARKIVISKSVLRDSMERAIRLDPSLAIKLFDKAFVNMDPDLDRRVIKIKLTATFLVILVVLLGCLGGIVYLVRAVFW